MTTPKKEVAVKETPVSVKAEWDKIRHTWFPEDSQAQEIIQYAWDKYHDLDFIKLIECENWQWNYKAVGDKGHAFGLCQMNNLYHKIPSEYYNNRQFQVDYCYTKYKWGTKFYWPSRIVKGQKCSSYVSNRFIIN